MSQNLERLHAMLNAGQYVHIDAVAYQVLNTDPNCPEAYLALALQAHHVHLDFHTAHKHAETALSSAPNHEYVIRIASGANTMIGNGERGLELANIALALEPDCPNCINTKVWALIACRDHDAAIDLANHGKSVAPQRPCWEAAKAKVYLREQQWSDAASAARASLALDAGQYTAYTQLGTALVNMGRIVDAEDAYRTSLAVRPDWIAAQNGLRECKRRRSLIRRLYRRIFPKPFWPDYEVEQTA